MSDKQSNILIIGINFFPEFTGIGKYTGEFAFYLAKNGHNVKVITGFPYYPHWKIYKGYSNWFYDTAIMDGVSITRCPIYVPELLCGSKRMLQDLSFFATAFIYLLKIIVFHKRYDMVFIASPSFMSGFLGMCYKFFYRKSVLVYHIQDLQVDAAEELGMIKNGALLRMIKWSERKILSKADWVTTISIGMKKKIMNKMAIIKNICIFPNWADFEFIYKKKSDLKTIALLGIPTEKRMVFYSGAVGEKQGIDMVLEIAAKSQQDLPELFFVIAGSGPYLEILKQRAIEIQLENILFIEIQPLEIFNELLNHAWLHLVLQKNKVGDLLLPSKLTNILAVGGLALITASPDTTLYELVKANEVGIIIPPDDLAAFWDVIVDLYNKELFLKDLKGNALIYAKNNLEKNVVIDNFLTEIGIKSEIN